MYVNICIYVYIYTQDMRVYPYIHIHLYGGRRGEFLPFPWRDDIGVDLCQSRVQDERFGGCCAGPCDELFAILVRPVLWPPVAYITHDTVLVPTMSRS